MAAAAPAPSSWEPLRSTWEIIRLQVYLIFQAMCIVVYAVAFIINNFVCVVAWVLGISQACFFVYYWRDIVPILSENVPLSIAISACGGTYLLGRLRGSAPPTCERPHPSDPHPPRCNQNEILRLPLQRDGPTRWILVPYPASD